MIFGALLDRSGSGNGPRGRDPRGPDRAAHRRRDRFVGGAIAAGLSWK
ncbi:Hypothetical protein A7982_03173 [Minicystis rosea]|nr:Hypothetical protein A7982_03173 [Minicystis rosea]